MEKEKVNPITAVSTENVHDEQEIISDQDATSSDKNPGVDASDNSTILEPDDFAQGEIDVKSQMDRATRTMDNATGRSRQKTKRTKIV